MGASDPKWMVAGSRLLDLTVALVVTVVLAGCSDGAERRSSARVPTAPSAIDTSTAANPGVVHGAAVAPGGGSPNVTQDVTFPPRNEPFDFRANVLEPKYRDQLRRPLQASFVDIEGTIVWTQEYLRYRVNGCMHLDAISRVFSQIDGRGIAAVCSVTTGTPIFPPRNEPLDFRQRLEAKYRDELRRAAIQTAVDIEGDIVWTQEYLRYRVSTCSHRDAIDKVIAQIDGRGVQPDCAAVSPPPPPPPPPPTQCGYSLSPTSNTVAVGGGAFSVNVSASAGCGWQLSSNQPWLTVSVTSGSGSASVGYTVAANSGAGRTGRITLVANGSAVATLDVGQTGTTIPPCAYSVSPTTLNIIPAGGTLTTSVSTTPGCTWTATSMASFLSIAGGSTGNGSGTVSIAVLNNTGMPRTGVVRVAWPGGSQDVTVSQGGVAPIVPMFVMTQGGGATDTCQRNLHNQGTRCVLDGRGSTGPINAYEWSVSAGGNNSLLTGAVVDFPVGQCVPNQPLNTTVLVTVMLTVRDALGQPFSSAPRQMQLVNAGCGT